MGFRDPRSGAQGTPETGPRSWCRASALDEGEQVGRAMIKVARDGFARPVLESEDINSV